MRMPKRGEKGFTLIELLIVVAILGVLAAVIIPNISRFFGAGKAEAAETEKSNVQLAVDSMMVANSISTIPTVSHPNSAVDGTTANTCTTNMAGFPDIASATTTTKISDPSGGTYTALDKDGYLLHSHDETADDAAVVLRNYMRIDTTTYYYAIDADGTVYQYADDKGTPIS